MPVVPNCWIVIEATRLPNAAASARLAPAATAHSVAGKTNLAWGCSAGEGCEASPFGAYYLLGADKIDERLAIVPDRDAGLGSQRFWGTAA